MTDPIADFLNRIKTAGVRKLPSFVVPHSRLKSEIAAVLEKAGYVKGSSVKGKTIKKFLQVELAYKNGAPRVRSVRRISKPGKRVYQGMHDIVSVREGKGISVLSTPKGILSDKEARKEKVGGELLFQIW